MVGIFRIIYYIKFRRIFYGKKKWYQLWLQFIGTKCKTIDDILGKNGVVQRLVKDVLENILEAEMDKHLGRVDRFVFYTSLYSILFQIYQLIIQKRVDRFVFYTNLSTLPLFIINF